MNPSAGKLTSSALSRAVAPSSGDLLGDLLLATSRTFGLAIPMLPETLREQVTVAYLLFRIADTIEDGECESATERADALRSFGSLFASAEEKEAPQDTNEIRAQLNQLRIDNADYKRLIEHLPEVFHAADSLPTSVRDILFAAVEKSAAGMTHFVTAGDPRGNVRLSSRDEVREYCYAVAGIVGEMLTELFINDAPELQSVANTLRSRSRNFGEGLQLVNILKDSEEDAAAGRSFIPENVARLELFELARDDLSRAEEYVQALIDANATPAVIAFCDLPVRLAWRTLEAVESDGPGAKVPRDEVATIVNEVLSRSSNGADAS